jgi:hypothetical protein
LPRRAIAQPHDGDKVRGLIVIDGGTIPTV